MTNSSQTYPALAPPPLEMVIELRKDDALLKSGEVDQPWEVVMSKRHTCLSEELKMMKGGVKSFDTFLQGCQSVCTDEISNRKA